MYNASINLFNNSLGRSRNYTWTFNLTLSPGSAVLECPFPPWAPCNYLSPMDFDFIKFPPDSDKDLKRVTDQICHWFFLIGKVIIIAQVLS